MQNLNSDGLLLIYWVIRTMGTLRLADTSDPERVPIFPYIELNVHDAAKPREGRRWDFLDSWWLVKAFLKKASFTVAEGFLTPKEVP